MRTTILRLLAIFALATTGIFGAAIATAQSDDIDEEKVDQSYVKVYMDWQGAASSGETQPCIVMVSVLDMVDEDSAAQLKTSMIEDMQDDDEYTGFEVEEIADLGDEAIHYVANHEGDMANSYGSIARDGDVLFFVMTLGADVDENLPTEIIEFMIEKGPSDEPVTAESDGTALTGGWVDAFPTAADFPELEGMDGHPVHDLLEDGFFGESFDPDDYADDDADATPDTDDDDND